MIREGGARITRHTYTNTVEAQNTNTFQHKIQMLNRHCTDTHGYKILVETFRNFAHKKITQNKVK